MIELLKARCKTLLSASGHYGRKLRESSFGGVAVLCYHGIREDGATAGRRLTFADLHVRAAELEQHCRLLREFCHPISFAELSLGLAGQAPLPNRPVLLTFDDGYRSVFHTARPILARHGIPAVAFVCSGPIERQSLVWYDAIARLSGEEEVERLKAMPYDQWRKRLGAICQPIDANDPSACMSIDEVQQLASAPGWEIGGHTEDHCILACANRQDQWEQIETNRSKLQAWTGRPLSCFAYPNGEPGVDFTAEAKELVRDAGFTAAFCTRPGFAKRADHPLELPRLMMVAGISAAELAHRLCYSWQHA